MPNRTLPESIRRSETLDEISDFAERLFFRLTVTADDFGRFHADPRIALADCFPLRVDRMKPARVALALEELGQAHLVRFYTVEGRRYGQFVTWDRHQRKRARFSKFPEPPADICPPMPADDDSRGHPLTNVSRDTRYEIRDTRETSADICQPWLDCLNSKAGRSFRPVESSLRHIRARLAEGFTLADAERVVADRVTRWRDDAKMAEYLRPETLFGTKFSGYLEAAKAADDTSRPYMGPTIPDLGRTA